VVSRSKKHELTCRFFCGGAFSPVPDLHPPELVVGDCHESHLSFRREYGPDIGADCAGGFFGRTIPGINRELEHREAAFEELLAELGVPLAIGLGSDREVEHGEEPHGAVPRKCWSKAMHRTPRGRWPRVSIRLGVGHT